MIQKLIGVFSLIILLTAGCKKSEADDLGGTAIIRGSLYIHDTLRSFSGALPLKNQEILVKYPADSNTLNYMYKVTTNVEGGYGFTNLQKGASYYLYSEKEEGGLTFASGKLINLTNDTTVVSDTLFPVFKKYSLLKITCRDTTAARNPLYNAQVCVFANDSAAQHNQCAGSIINTFTDISGNVFFPKLPARTYYINAQLATPGNTIKQVRYLPVNVSATGIVSETIFLQ